jgi:hypothetical protein
LQLRGCHEAGLWPGRIQQHHIRAFLLSLEDNFTTIGGNVRIADVEVASDAGQLPCGARVQVDEPEVLMLNPALQTMAFCQNQPATSSALLNSEKRSLAEPFSTTL